VILVRGGSRRYEPGVLGCRRAACMVRDYVTEHLADENAVLVIDETGISQAM
jgi:hypothetical protein